MTREEALKVIAVAQFNPTFDELRQLLVKKIYDGISPFELFEYLCFSGANLDDELLYEALFLDEFKKFVAMQQTTPPTAP